MRVDRVNNSLELCFLPRAFGAASKRFRALHDIDKRKRYHSLAPNGRSRRDALRGGFQPSEMDAELVALSSGPRP